MLEGQLHSVSGGEAAVEARATREYIFSVPATLIAGAQDFMVGCNVVEDGEVQSVEIGFSTDITGDNTDYFTLLLKKNDGAGGAETTVASLAFLTGEDATTEALKALTLAGSGASSVTAGQALGLEITKTGSGLVSPALNVIVKVLAT